MNTEVPFCPDFFPAVFPLVFLSATLSTSNKRNLNLCVYGTCIYESFSELTTHSEHADAFFLHDTAV